MYGYDLSSRSRTLKSGRCCLMKLLLGEQRLGLGLGGDELDVRDLGDHVRATRGPPGFEKWPATRLRIELALPT